MDIWSQSALDSSNLKCLHVLTNCYARFHFLPFPTLLPDSHDFRQKFILHELASRNCNWVLRSYSYFLHQWPCHKNHSHKRKKIEALILCCIYNTRAEIDDANKNDTEKWGRYRTLFFVLLDPFFYFSSPFPPPISIITIIGTTMYHY